MWRWEIRVKENKIKDGKFKDINIFAGILRLCWKATSKNTNLVTQNEAE